jgi:hypothetical protein
MTLPPRKREQTMSKAKSQVHHFIVEHFDAEELRTVCFNLGIRYDDLRGEGHIAKARELVLWAERREMLDDLLNELQQSRPDLANRIAITSQPTDTPATERASDSSAASAEGSGAVAQDHSVAAGAGGAGVGRDVHGPVIIAGEGAHITVTSRDFGDPEKESRVDGEDEPTSSDGKTSPASGG